MLKYRAGFVFLSFFGVRIPLTTIEQDEKQPTFEELQCASRFPSAIEFSTPINHTHRNFRHHVNKFVKTLVPNILTSDTYTLYQNTRQTVTLSTALSNMHEVFTDWEPSDMHEYFFLNPTGRLLEVMASPTITHVTDAQYVPLTDIPENCTFTFTCHGFDITHDSFDLSRSKLSYEFSHREAHIDYTIINQENGSRVFSIGMRCNNMSNRRIRHHLASFCLHQLRITSFQIAHYMRNIQIEA